MPNQRIGVIVFVIGDHTAPLYNAISHNVYERLLGLEQTPFAVPLIVRGIETIIMEMRHGKLNLVKSKQSAVRSLEYWECVV